MRNKTRTLFTILCALLLLIVISSKRSSLHAAPTGVYFDVEVEEHAMVGELIPVEIHIRNVESLDERLRCINALFATIYFDSTKFEIESINHSSGYEKVHSNAISLGTALQSANFTKDDIHPNIYTDDSPDHIEISIVDFGSAPGVQKLLKSSGHLLTLYFRVKDDAIGSGDFYMEEVVGFNPNEIWLELTDIALMNVGVNSSPKTVTFGLSTRTTINGIALYDAENNSYVPSLVNGSYQVVVPSNLEKFRLEVTPTFSMATVIETGDVHVDRDNFVHSFQVVAQDKNYSKTYNLVIRRASSDSSLEIVTITNGHFSDNSTSLALSTQTEYALEVHYSTTLELNFKTSSQYAFVEGGSNHSIDDIVPGEEFDYEVVVTAENGTKTTYLFKITMLPSSNNVSIYSIVAADTFHPIVEDNKFTFNIPYTMSNPVQVCVILEDPTSTLMFDNGKIKFSYADGVYVSDPIHLNPGIKLYSLIVTATSGQAENYTVIFQKENLSKDSSLSKLLIDGQSVAGFQKTKYEYFIDSTLLNQLDLITIDAESDNPYATITGLGQFVLETGYNRFEVKSIVRDPLNQTIVSETKYNIYYYKEIKNSIVKVDSISINEELIVDFDPETLIYQLTVDKHVKGVSIFVRLNENSKGATILGDGYHLIGYGNNELPITVASQDGLTSFTYKLQIIKEELSTETGILLQVEGIPLIKDSDYLYTANVQYQTTSVLIQGTLVDVNATVTGLGNQILTKTGTNEFIIKVTAEDGVTIQEFKISLNREVPSTNSYLETLQVNVGALSFDRDTKEYTLEVHWNVLQIVVTAKAESNTARILPGKTNDLEQIFPLNYGINKIEIIVEAEDGSLGSYSIMVNRQVNLSNDTSLSSLVIEGYDPFILKSGDEFVDKFQLIVPFSQTEIKIKAVAGSSKAILLNPASKSLSVGPNEVDIYVYAEDKTYQRYNVLVIREPLSSNNRLSNITIEGYEGLDFNPNIEQYTVYIQDVISKITVKAEKVDELAEVTIVGATSLQEGVNTVEIHVKAQDESIRTYTLLVVLGIPSSPQEEGSSTWLYAFLAMAPVTLGLGVMFVLKATKLKKFIK